MTARKTLLSRSGRSSPLGKRTEEMRTKVSVPVKEEVARRMHAAGILSESEFLAEFLETQLFGIDHAARLHMERLRIVSGKSKE